MSLNVGCFKDEYAGLRVLLSNFADFCRNILLKYFKNIELQIVYS